MTEPESRAAALVRRLTPPAQALTELPAAERLVVAAGLSVLARCAGILERVDALVAVQRATAERGRAILEMFPPLLGKLGQLLDLEIANARERLTERRRR